MNDQVLMNRAGLKHSLYRDLAADVTGRAQRVIVGLNWTLVEGPDGAGLSHTPARGTGGCFSLPDPGGYRGRDLASLAAMVDSDNVFETAIAIAAANAFHNRYDLTGSRKNGLDLIPNGGSDTVIVGRFPGIDQRIPEARVIEREPGPNDYPESAAEILLPECRHLIVTASTMLDGALPRLLSLAPQAYTILLGPGTPMAATLFEHGIDALSGLIVDDIDALSQAVIEGGAVRAMKRHSHNLSLFKPGP
ncbi:MAG: DUF364 domain-containing protein [Alphaproteobacteria bacterium]